jgi:hypothetical protein
VAPASKGHLRDVPLNSTIMKIDNSCDGLRLLQKHPRQTSFNTTAKYRKITGEELRKKEGL